MALPNTPAEARAIPLGSLTISDAMNALNMAANQDAQIAMAKLIADHGRKYRPEARDWCRRFSS